MTELELAALQASEGKNPTPKAIMALAADVGEELARWAFLQHTLRGAGARKFELACEMLFDREGLEMASSALVADYHASMFPSGTLVVDLTAGIGADTLALARRGPVRAVEVDEDRARLLRHNLSVHHLSAEVVIGDALDEPPTDYLFADPARRSGQRFSRHLEAYQPSPEALLSVHSAAKRFAIKLSPMLPDSELESLSAGGPYLLEFLSVDGECPEVLFIVGKEISETWRGAVMLPTVERLAEEPLYESIDSAGGWVYEANPAAIRAHGLGSFGIPGLGSSNGYLTSDSPVSSPWLRGFRVLDDGPLDVKRIRQVLVSLDARTPEVKLRAVKEDPARLRKQWRQEGEREVVVMLYPVGPKIRAVVAELEGP